MWQWDLTNILGGAQDRKNTPDSRKSIIFVLFLLQALAIILEETSWVPIFRVDARNTEYSVLKILYRFWLSSTEIILQHISTIITIILFVVFNNLNSLSFNMFSSYFILVLDISQNSIKTYQRPMNFPPHPTNTRKILCSIYVFKFNFR